MDEVFKLQADVLKTLANSRRLEIIHLLAERPSEVNRLAEALGISQPNVSQHLAVLRAGGIVEAERDGREMHYRLSDPEIIVACETMRGVLVRRISRISAVAVRAVEAARDAEAASEAEAGAERTAGAEPGRAPSGGSTD
jgi:DNA-binding transcriptional ArsR family regulator